MRRLAFSTLGCPELLLTGALDLAHRFGFGGLELRCGPKEAVRVDLPARERAGVRAELDARGIVAVGLASYLRVADEGISDDSWHADLVAHVELAADVGAGLVRVFPGAPAPGPDADRRAADRLRQAAGAAAAAGVVVVLETHDSHPRGADVARVLTGVDAPAGLGALWDVQHPWAAGEGVDVTAAALHPWLAHVQVADAVRDGSGGGSAPTAPGAGEVPLARVLRALDRRDYRGWLSFEYPRAWHPRLPPLEQALPAFRSWLARAGAGPAAELPPG